MSQNRQKWENTDLSRQSCIMKNRQKLTKFTEINKNRQKCTKINKNRQKSIFIENFLMKMVFVNFC